MFFRTQKKPIDFDLGDNISVTQMVTINTIVRPGFGRFGVHRDHIRRFTEALFNMEVDGKKVRTRYVISAVSAEPQAENFMWTILGNKVRSIMSLFVYVKITNE